MKKGIIILTLFTVALMAIGADAISTDQHEKLTVCRKPTELEAGQFRAFLEDALGEDAAQMAKGLKERGWRMENGLWTKCGHTIAVEVRDNKVITQIVK